VEAQLYTFCAPCCCGQGKLYLYLLVNSSRPYMAWMYIFHIFRRISGIIEERVFRRLCPNLKGKISPITGPRGPEGSRKLRFPDFVAKAQDGGRLSAVRTGRFYPQETGTHFCYWLIQLQGRSTIGRILCQWKIHRQFVAQHLNPCATAVPNLKGNVIKSDGKMVFNVNR